MTASRRALGSDLAKVDQHVIQPDEYEDIPELDEAWFEKAQLGLPLDVAALREREGLSQEAFAARYGLNVHTLRQWEQGRRLPQGPARVLLTVLEREPEAVARALETP